MSDTGTIGAIGNAGPTRLFTVNASEYVRDKCHVFPIQFVFPSNFDHTLSLISLNLGFSLKRIRVTGKTFVCHPLDLQSLPLACSRELLIRSMAKQFWLYWTWVSVHLKRWLPHQPVPSVIAKPESRFFICHKIHLVANDNLKECGIQRATLPLLIASPLPGHCRKQQWCCRGGGQ